MIVQAYTWHLVDEYPEMFPSLATLCWPQGWLGVRSARTVILISSGPPDSSFLMPHIDWSHNVYSRSSYHKGEAENPREACPEV